MAVRKTLANLHLTKRITTAAYNKLKLKLLYKKCQAELVVAGLVRKIAFDKLRMTDKC